MTRLITPLVLATATLQLGACSTVARGLNTDMVVDSDPPGATVTTDLPARGDMPAGRGCPATPCEFEVPHKSMFLMTIAKEGYAPIEIGVVPRRGRETLDQTAVGSGGTGLAAGVTVGSLGGLAMSGFGYSTASSVGAGLAVGAAAATGVTVVVGGASLLVDEVSGASHVPNPNPIYVVLPEEGETVVEHPTVERLHIWRMEGKEGRAARKAYKRAEKEARKAAKRAHKAAEKAAKEAAKSKARAAESPNG